MKKTKSFISLMLGASVGLGLVSPVIAQEETAQSDAVPENVILFDEPASQGTASGGDGAGSAPNRTAWQQLSLPIGNSLLGANIFGEYDVERLTFNQKTVWNGGPSSKRPNYNGGNKTTIDGMETSEFYKQLVETFKDPTKTTAEKTAMANKLVGESNGYGSYQLLGDIYLDFDRNNNSEWNSYWEQYWANGTTILDDRDSSITYTGWSDYSKTGWHNDTEKYTNTAGAEINFSFTGRGIRMIGARNGECGKLDVYLDGTKVLEDHVMTASSAADGQELFSLTDLEDGEHTIRIVNKAGGTHNKATFDYFQIKTASAPLETVVDLNPTNAAQTGVQYSSDWSTWSRSGDSDAAEWVNAEEMYVNSCTTNTSITYTFTGTGIALYGAKNGNSAANMGSFTWSIDGSEPQTVNCVREENTLKRMELFSRTDLSAGEHTLTIKGVEKKLSFDNLVVTDSSKSAEDLVKPQPPEEHTAATNYSRWLDIDNSVAGVEYDRDETHYVREYIASHPDNVIAMKLSADGAKTLDFDFSLPMAAEGDAANGKTSTTTGTTGELNNMKTGDLYIASTMNDNGMKLATNARVMTDAGTVTYTDGILEIRGAGEAVIFVSAATDYKNEYPEYRTGETAEQVMDRAKADVTAAAAKGYAAVRKDHIDDYKEIYDRVKLDLGQTKPEKTTDVLLAGYKNKTIPETERRYLEQELFQYGRYLLISSSRENAEGRTDQDLPANLQGVWNIYCGATSNVPWGSDYHMNVNLQMNYWPAYSTNMAECALPMIDYEDSLREPGRVTASTYFGIDNSNGQHNGYTAHTQNTPFGWTCPGWAFSWGWSPAAVPWMLQNVYEYYEFTQDTDYLRNVIFPMMEEESKLYEAILTEMTYTNGVTRLTTVPAYSPEHGPYTAGNVYENSLVWQLFNDCIEAATALNEADPEHPVATAEKIAQWQSIKDQLKPIEIGTDGQIKEWYDETTLGSVSGADRKHRHLSHMLGLFPGDLITSDTPELIEAAKVSLNDRGDDATGWGLAQRLNSWARAKDGNRAMDLIESLFKSGIYNNLWDAHPPFQIDGNFGYTSGVSEMLAQSNGSTIELLPAMPDEWADGSVEGLVARGNFELDFAWKDGTLTEASVLSKAGGTCQLTNPAFANVSSVHVTDSKGNEAAVSAIEGKENSISFDTDSGTAYSITFGDEKTELTSASITAASAELTAGSSMELTISGQPKGVAITAADWSAVDADGNAVSGVTITPSAVNPAKATLRADASVADGTVITVKASKINGLSTVSAEKAITVVSTPGLVDLGKNSLTGPLPDTAVLTEKDGERVMQGSMTMPDPNLDVTKALSAGSFTVSSWLYVPADVASTTTGTWEDGDKHNMIASIGDAYFALRFDTASNGTVYAQTYIKNDSGWKTASSSSVGSNFTNAWHEVSAVYDAAAKKLTLYLDGTELASKDSVESPAVSDKALEIGFMSDKPQRKSELSYGNIKVINKALSAAQLTAMSAGTSDLAQEDVVLWAEFSDVASARTELSALLDECALAKEEDYTAESWNTFKAAKEAAQALNPVYATAKNIKDAKAALSAAKEALEPVSASQIDTTVLEMAVNKGDKVTEAIGSFKDAGKTELAAALASAKAELANPTSQADVNAKAKELNTALLAMRLTPSSEALEALK